MNPARRPVVVVLGQPGTDLISSLRAVGLAPIAPDGEVVVWGSPPSSSPDRAPSVAGPPGTAANLLMTIRDAAAALGLGRSTVYELIGQGRLEVVHVGRSARIPAEAVRSFVEQLRCDEGLNAHWPAVG